MGRLLENPGLELVLRWILGATFVYSSLHKIAEPALFAKIVYGYYLLPQSTINLIAITVPFVELISGLALLTGIYPRAAACILQVLLLGFIVVISINLIRGVEFDCGCFSIGQAGHTSAARHLLVRDVFYFLAGLPVLFFPGRRKWCLHQTGGLLTSAPADA